MERTEFAENLKKVANERKMSQSKLAELCEVTDVTMSRYFNGQRIPNAILLLKIANALGVNPCELLDYQVQKEYPARIEHTEDGITVTFHDSKYVVICVERTRNGNE